MTIAAAFKQCKKCDQWKTSNDFPKGQLRCKVCTALHIKQWSYDNREKINRNQLKYHTTITGRSSVLLNAALKRAKLKNELFGLTLADVVKGLSIGVCSKTGVDFDFELRERGTNVYKINPFSPSIDKIDPFGIYEVKNVQYVCSWYNLAKGQMSEELLIQFCKRVAELNS